MGRAESRIVGEGEAAGALLSGYLTRPGVHDEMVTAEGRLRPHYRPLIEAIAAMAPAERAARFRSARQYLREAGVFYRVYGTGGTEDERGWPLAHPALVIETGEWRALEAGLVERAEFLERLGADLYGERSLVSAGRLPASLVGRNPEFLRPLSDQGRSGKPLIRFIAVDLGRGPDGAWRVLGDRTQAPSGAGFALENRVATARAFPEIASSLRIERLAGFFARFRDALFKLNGTGSHARIGLLTPGPLNETYFEHAYLARYLGFLLLEGGDLVVHGTAVEVRTVDGFKPMRVLWRRLDADFADPLELMPRSYIGTPGLARAVRAGNVEVVNALGSGILETKALMAFQPVLADALMGQTLRLPTIPTWWGGEPAGNAYIGGHAARLAVAAAFPQAAGSPPPAASGEALAMLLRSGGTGLVGQEPVALSTAPVFVGDRLEAHPVTLRVFLARDEEGWHVMPGGFARVSEETGETGVSMQAGGRSIDVWVSSESEARPVTLFANSAPARFVRRVPGALPARAADNLYWLGRYAERAEVATRLLRLYAARAGSGPKPGPLESQVSGLLKSLGVDTAGPRPADGLIDLARGAFDIASRIRDRFSPDGWRVLGEIVELLSGLPKEEAPDLIETTSAVLTRLAGFTGLVRENMYQFAGWRFLSSGRHVERGRMTALVCSRLIAGGAPEGALEALLEFTDSRVTYRRRYSVSLSPGTVLDLGVLDPFNPRSVAYQLNALKEAIGTLPGVTPGASLDQLARRVARLQVRLATAGPAEVNEAFLDRIANDLSDLSDLLTQRYFAAGPDAHEAWQEHE